MPDNKRVGKGIRAEMLRVRQVQVRVKGAHHWEPALTQEGSGEMIDDPRPAVRQAVLAVDRRYNKPN